MKKTQIMISNLIFASFISAICAPYARAEEKIIQKEALSFEKCLKVITTSENKLSIAPKTVDVSDQKRVAVFTLADGTLTITCDGKNNSVTVSTNMN